MKSRIFFIIGSVLLAATVLIVIGVSYVLLSERTVVPSKEAPSTILFPSSPVLGPGVQEASLQIPTQEGMLEVHDFLNNGVTAEDPANPGSYYLAGSSGYCESGSSCPSGASTENFNIVYFSDEQSFVIALTAEPLRGARLDAEQFLMRSLGVSQESMCSLNYFLSTDSYTNSTFAGADLKFSFCPGAIVLP